MASTTSALKRTSRAASAAIEGGLPRRARKKAKGKAEPKPELKTEGMADLSDPEVVKAFDAAIETEPAQPEAEKPAATKKAAKPEPKAGRSGAVSNDSVISVKKTEHDLKGKRGMALDLLLKDGQTVEAYKKALTKKEAGGESRLGTYAGWALKTALELKLIVLK